MANISMILKAAKSAKSAATKAEKAAAAEKAQRTLDAICRKATENAKGWLAGERERFEADIRDFFKDKTAQAALSDGVGVFFGKDNELETRVSKNYGPYVISLEGSLPGSHFPTVMKVSLRANVRVSKFIAKRLYVSQEELDRNSIEGLLMHEHDGHLRFRFVPVEELEKAAKDANAELIEMGTTEASGVEVYLTALVVAGQILLNRSDWFEGSKYGPDGKEIDFDLWHVYVPKAE